MEKKNVLLSHIHIGLLNMIAELNRQENALDIHEQKKYITSVEEYECRKKIDNNISYCKIYISQLLKSLYQMNLMVLFCDLYPDFSHECVKWLVSNHKTVKSKS